MSSSLLIDEAIVPASAGWGIVCVFQAKSALMHGMFALEFSSAPLTLRQARVLASPVPRFLSDINIERPWADVEFHFIKKSREPKWLAPDLMNRLTNELKWAAEKTAWCQNLRALGEAGRNEELKAECHKLIGKVIDVLPEFKVRYIADLSAEPLPAGEESAASVPSMLATLVVNPQSDPMRGMMISELRAGDEVFVKILDQTPRGLAVREQLGGVDEEGRPRAVACPFRELKPLDDRGNFALTVGLADNFIGVAEVYHSVKVKTTRSVLAAAVAAPGPVAMSSGADDQPEEASLLAPWMIVIAAAMVLMVVAWLLKSFTG